jgi:hypothetical protein
MARRRQTVEQTRNAGNSLPPSVGRAFMMRYWAWVALVLVLLCSAAIRLRLLDFPLERDEGEYAYMGQLMLQGIPPYQIAANMKFPGVYDAYALIMALFGQTPSGIHLGILLINAAAIVLTFLLARRLWDGQAGVVAAAAYALMTLTRDSLGLAGHATHFVVLFAFGAVLLMLIAIERPRLWIHLTCGLLIGIAILMKQPAVFFGTFVLLYPLWHELRVRPVAWKGIIVRVIAVCLGILLPLLITALALWRAGVFSKFWFWTITYAGAYGAEIPVSRAHVWLVRGFSQMATNTLSLWLAAAAGLLLLCLSREGRRTLPFIAGLTFFSFMAVCPGWWFRLHYFIMMMPAVAMLIAGGLFLLRHIGGSDRPHIIGIAATLVIIVLAGRILYLESDLLLRLKPDDASRFVYRTNPFVESRRVGLWLRDNTQPTDRLAVVGSEPEIYFYSHRKSATSFLYTFPMMEPQPYNLKMQQEMAAEIEAARPEYLVVVQSLLSWVPFPNSPMWIFDWCNRYGSNYDVIGDVRFGADESQYTWGPAAAALRPAREQTLVIMKRKDK